LRETRPHEFFGRLHIGKFEDGDESEVSFRIVNEGSQAIRLNKPIGTCGCLKIQVSNSVIPPGGNIDATLSVKIDAKRQAFWRQKLFFDGEKLGDAHGKRTLNRWDAKDLR
jgi:hypothetical protein